MGAGEGGEGMEEDGGGGEVEDALPVDDLPAPPVASAGEDSEEDREEEEEEEEEVEEEVVVLTGDWTEVRRCTVVVGAETWSTVAAGCCAARSSAVGTAPIEEMERRRTCAATGLKALEREGRNLSEAT